MNLMIVRHAESTANSEDRWQGRADFRLSEAGRNQADRLRLRLELEGYRPTRVYTSPLSRALETARIAASNWDRPIEQWNELAEIDVGVVAGLSPAEVEEQFPEVAGILASTHNFDLVEGAENLKDSTARAQRLVDRLMGEHNDEDRVLAFTHGGIMAHIIERLLGTDRLWGLGSRNTAIFEFSINVNSWFLEDQTRANRNLWRINRFNDVRHLD